MLCDKCKKNVATTHIKTVINGQVTNTHLCGECAMYEGISSYKPTNIADMLLSVFDDEKFIDTQKKNIKKCSLCGTTFQEIANNGKVGCGECYKTFFEELLPYIKRIHGSTKHIATDNLNAHFENKNDDINKLKEKLKILIKEERFEEAAEIRDKIKESERKE